MLICYACTVMGSSQRGIVRPSCHLTGVLCAARAYKHILTLPILEVPRGAGSIPEVPKHFHGPGSTQRILQEDSKIQHYNQESKRVEPRTWKTSSRWSVHPGIVSPLRRAAWRKSRRTPRPCRVSRVCPCFELPVPSLGPPLPP